MFVEAIVDGGAVDINLGVSRFNGGNPFRCRDDRQNHHLRETMAPNQVNRGVGGTTRGQHGIDKKHDGLVGRRRQLAIILHGLFRLMIAKEPHKAYLGGRQQRQQAVQHTDPSPQHGDNDHIVVHAMPGGMRQRGLYVIGRQLDVLQGLVGQQHRDLANQLTKLLVAGIHGTQNR